MHVDALPCCGLASPADEGYTERLCGDGAGEPGDNNIFRPQDVGSRSLPPGAWHITVILTRASQVASN